jgi:hypothetical protein
MHVIKVEHDTYAVDAPKDVEKIEVLQKRERFARQTVSLRLKAVVQSV